MNNEKINNSFSFLTLKGQVICEMESSDKQE